MAVALDPGPRPLARNERLQIAPRRGRGPADAAELRRLAALTEAMETVMERHNCAVIQLDRFGRVSHLAAAARELLEAYCNWRGGSSLPLTIEAWRRSNAPQLVISGRSGKLHLSMIEEPRWRAIVIEEQRSAASDPQALEELGLTRRQAQVLSLLTAGKSNEQIARELVISRATVSKHLERVYELLGVSSRSQAVVRALG